MFRLDQARSPVLFAVTTTVLGGLVLAGGMKVLTTPATAVITVNDGCEFVRSRA